ncbi:phage portal protein [Rhodococcus hoagii]|nr:phage portal protein [Prescottella equi]NKZ92221.1 phage portal protein [Prescottella equi]
MTVFQSLGELGKYMASASPSVELVDPGYPLGEALDINAENVLKNQPGVRKVTGFIARNVASVPFHLYERKDDTDRPRVTDHVIAAALGQPRRKVTPYRFWHDVMMDQLLHDRYCITFSVDDRGELVLTRLPANRVRFKENDLGEMVRVRYSNSAGEQIDLDPDVCIYDVGYAPRGDNGLSPIETLRHLLAENTEAIEYRRGVFKNAGRIPQIITRPLEAPDWTDKARGRFKESFAAFRKGGGQEGGVPIFEDGMKLEAVTSFRPRDIVDLEGRKLTDAEVASAYFIAPELVGAREGTYSNLEAFRQMLYRDALGPWISALEQALNIHLVPMFNDGRRLYVEANLDAKLRGSFEEQAKILQSSTGAPWLTRNEARARANLPAIAGGDELVTPLNVLVGGQASPNDSAPDKPNPGGGGSAEGAATTDSSTPKSDDSADDFKKRADAVGLLIRSGFDPNESRDQAKLPPIKHLGLLPVTVQKPGEENPTPPPAEQGDE